VTRLVVRSTLGGTLRLRLKEALTTADGELKAAEGESANPFFETQTAKEALIHQEGFTVNPTYPETLLGDIETQAGKSYVFSAL
jgi:alpha-L-fucosidase 2